jgi:glutamate/tyrosine decarboxylase-like PLP-dependent enzyme
VWDANALTRHQQNGIADVCQKHGVWLHVDGAWGGSVLVSKKWRHKMAGVERADSVTWCLHKMMGINQQCAAFLTKESHLLVRCPELLHTPL